MEFHFSTVRLQIWKLNGKFNAVPLMLLFRKLELEREENGDYQYQNVVPTPFKEYGKAKPSKAVNVYCEICKTSTSNLASVYIYFYPSYS